MYRYTMEENEFDMAKEAYYGTMFSLSNGYIGIRGSLEENGSLGVQGAFVRGVIDEIPFNQSIKIDNEYMRKYYINEDAAKDAEFQEGIINFADVLFLKISIDGETFVPWEGKIKKWNRTLDIKNNRLLRTVVWETSKGYVTELCFERFISFADDHILAQRVAVKPINHNREIEVSSGADLRTKSSGFKMCKTVEHEFEKNSIKLKLQTKGKYAHKYNICIKNNETCEENIFDGNFIYQKFVKKGRFVFDKVVHISTSRDRDYKDGYNILDENYEELYEAHKKSWSDYFKNFDIKIQGDDDADFAIRFCAYQTAVSICRNDSVHSLGAKNLTGEAYNNYVWWDCEVYQAPVFLYSGDLAIKNLLQYRYNNIDAAREMAKREGRCGARFPFISSVTGEEKVWKHVRHPFMQVHVVADVAWNLINYYNATADKEYMKSYGLKTLENVADYWCSRVEWKNDRYEICEVTGCDEHHPYVDNDAYTNYLVKYVLDSTIRINKELGRGIKDKWSEVAEDLYLPMDKNGYIPQFDGYFDLYRGLKTHGGEHKNFQMKTAGGLYHESQIIKQPDVMVLFSHIDFDMPKEIYEKNWDYYESMCEASSSLTYPTHAICAFDNNQLYKGYKYLMNCAKMDIDDLHGGAEDGIHAGCAAGAWYAVVRGMMGIKITKDEIRINPKLIPWWKKVSLSVAYKGVRIFIELSAGKCILKSDGDIKVKYQEKMISLKKGKRIEEGFYNAQ